MLAGFFYQMYANEYAETVCAVKEMYNDYGYCAASNTGWLFFFLGAWTILGHITGLIAESKGKMYVPFFALGFLLPVIGLLVASLMSPSNGNELGSGNNVKCPFCAEVVSKEAILCKHCKSNLQIHEKTNEN